MRNCCRNPVRILFVTLLVLFFTGTCEVLALDYPIVDTNQTDFYSDDSNISEPSEGDDYYGQDAQFDGNQPSYTLSDDGLTVTDNVTGLTWTRSADTDGDGDTDTDDKLTYDGAQSYPDTLNSQNYGGYSDWRLPSAKELYSLMDFRGTDPNVTGTDTSILTAFIDTDYFDFAWGDTDAGERIIDAQYWSTDIYVSTILGGSQGVFGLNLADGRIKGYEITSSKRVLLVRGNTAYGTNDFTDNGDGTVTDSATGLMWARDDSGAGYVWKDALAWVQEQNEAGYLGYSDWRMPNAKELQSIIDYTRSPDTTGSAAIDAKFDATAITSEGGETDYPWYWTGTTHLKWDGSVENAVYICFGRAMGYYNGEWTDVHGAGAQRSGKKNNDYSGATYVDYGYYAAGSPQGDAVRKYNYVRLVRDSDTSDTSAVPEAVTLTSPSGSVDTSTPAYTWEADDNATWYKLFVWDSDQTRVISTWVDDDDVCTDGTCTTTPSDSLADGSYEWYIKSWNDTGSAWSDGQSFSVSTAGSTTPDKIVLISPSGTQTSTSLSLTWEEDEAATWYRVYVSYESPSDTYAQWYEIEDNYDAYPEAACQDGECSVTLTFEEGSYQWWVKGWNENGSGEWSDGLAFSVDSH